MRLRDAVFKDLPRIMELQSRVVAGLANVAMFHADDLDFYAAVLAEGGVISLAEDGGVLAGCSILRLPPSEAPDNLGFDLGLNATERARVAHLEAAFLSPEFRGQGLALCLGRRNMRRAALAGRRIVCATAWPGNKASIRNLEALGLRAHGETTKYGGLQRLLLWCALIDHPDCLHHRDKEYS